MHEYEIVEKKWQRYHRKKIASRFLLVFLGIAIASMLIYAIYTKSVKQTSTPKIESQNTTAQSLSTPIHQKSDILHPDLSFERNLGYIAKRLAHTNSHGAQTTNMHKKNDGNITNAIPTHTTHKIVAKTVTATKLDIIALRKQFAQTKDIGIAIIIAQEYYRQKLYPLAIKWSLKANNIDKNNEDSWLIFAKSMYKMGKKETALNALRIYYKKSHSKKAAMLYRLMLKGKF